MPLARAKRWPRCVFSGFCLCKEPQPAVFGHTRQDACPQPALTGPLATAELSRLCAPRRVCARCLLDLCLPRGRSLQRSSSQVRLTVLRWDAQTERTQPESHCSTCVQVQKLGRKLQLQINWGSRRDHLDPSLRDYKVLRPCHALPDQLASLLLAPQLAPSAPATSVSRLHKALCLSGLQNCCVC